MAEYNKVYASLKPELPKVIQQEQIYVYAPKSSRVGMKSITGFNITAPVVSVQYDTTDGITVTGNSSLVSEEVSGEKLTQNFQSEFRIPVRPGKYINIDADADNNYVVIKVDDAELNRNYYKITRSSTANVPAFSPSLGIITLPYSYQNSGASLVRRGSEGEAKFTYGIFGRWNDIDGGNTLKFDQIYRQLGPEQGTIEIAPTTGDEGTLLALIMQSLKDHPLLTIRYKSQLYYRMDPFDAPDGTLNYIHIDSVQKEVGGYKATGKCFSITVSTRAWKVFDLDFGGSSGGIEQIGTLIQSEDYQSGDVSVTIDGIKYQGFTDIQYTDSDTGEIKTQIVQTTNFIPLKGSDYINIDAEEGDSRAVVRLDDINMSQNFVKIDKTKNSVIPQFWNGKIQWDILTTGLGPNSVVQRAGDNSTYLEKLYVNRFATTDNEYEVPTQAITYGGYSDGFTVEKTTTDTGTLTATVMDAIRSYPNAGLKYDNQSYIRMDPTDAPDGTISFIHLDSVQDGAGGYTMTGKCFSVTVSTRAWQVVDLDFFGNVNRTTHNLTITNSATGTNIYFSLVNNRIETYEGAPAGLWSALEDNMIACTVDVNGQYAAGIITTDGDNFKAIYGNGEELLMTQTQISITDNNV